MDDLRPDAVAARVVAWHNRHPLARRITAAHVQGIGFVALPFVARPGAAPSDPLADMPTLSLADAAGPAPGEPAGGSLRTRARARARPAQTAADDPRVDPPFDPPPATADAFFSAGTVAAPQGSVVRLQAWWARRSARRRRASLLRRAAGLRAEALKRAFSERFLPPLSARLVARFALRHGRLDVAAFSTGAMRRVLPDTGLLGDSGATTTLYLATAAIEVGRQRARVLLGDGPTATAIGSRVFSHARVAGVFASLALAAGLLAAPLLPPPPGMAELRATPVWRFASGWMQRIRASEPVDNPGPRLAQADPSAGPMADPTSASDSATSSADTMPPPEPVPTPEPIETVAAAASAPEPAAHIATSGSTLLASAAVPAPAAAASAALFPDDPAPAEKRAPGSDAIRLPTHAGGIPNLRPQLDEDTKAAARQAMADLRAARGLAAPVPPPSPPPSPRSSPEPAVASSPLPPPVQAPVQVPRVAATAPRVAATAPVQLAAARLPTDAPAFALSTRLLRTRAESEQVMIAWRALLVADPRQPLNVGVMPAGDDWRVVCWPFASRQQAERARAVLLSRGLKAETVDF